jgi:methyltransferase, FkbM family
MTPDFTQHAEQGPILAVAGQAGRLLDVGANDGVTFSMTRALMQDRDWRGVFIEPSPVAFLALLKTYEGTRKADLINAAIGLEWGLTPFWMTEDLLSTTDAAHVKKWTTGGYPFHKPYWVPILPFQHVLDQFGPFDMINIDVEGNSHALFDCALAHQPRVLAIEHDGYAISMNQRAKGYRIVCENSINLVLAR